MQKIIRQRGTGPRATSSRNALDCGRLLRARLWKLYEEGQFGRLRRGRGAVEYMKHLEHPDE
jgi:hypothetical protein